MTTDDLSPRERSVDPAMATPEDLAHQAVYDWGYEGAIRQTEDMIAMGDAQGWSHRTMDRWQLVRLSIIDLYGDDHAAGRPCAGYPTLIDPDHEKPSR